MPSKPPPLASLTQSLAGEEVIFFADRALFWPKKSRLLIADLHLGKAETFRRAGIALPSGSTQHDLMRLNHLLMFTGAKSLWILGDFLHSKQPDAEWKKLWLTFREQYSHTDMLLLTGNHDKYINVRELKLIDGGERIVDKPFVLQHFPIEDASGHTLSGHLHPVVKVPGLPGRHPSFVIQPTITTLPAFSKFTGGFLIKPTSGLRFITCFPDALLAWPMT